MIQNEIFEDLIEHNYYRVESIRMQGMVLSVFAKRKLLNQIRHVKSDWIGTGYANFWGNKGTVSSLPDRVNSNACPLYHSSGRKGDETGEKELFQFVWK